MTPAKGQPPLHANANVAAVTPLTIPPAPTALPDQPVQESSAPRRQRRKQLAAKSGARDQAAATPWSMLDTALLPRPVTGPIAGMRRAVTTQESVSADARQGIAVTSASDVGPTGAYFIGSVSDAHTVAASAPVKPEASNVFVGNTEFTNTTPRAKAAMLHSMKPDGPIFLDRELSWLEFNRRVLQEAKDARTPLLERLRYMSIFTSNLDEFFMKRVGGLKRQLLTTPLVGGAGLVPRQRLDAIRQAVHVLVAEQTHTFQDLLLPALREQGIYLHTWLELSPLQVSEARDYFRRTVFPVLTPLSVDPGHPFPFISNLSLSLGVLLRSPDSDENIFARVKVPGVLPQWVRVSNPPETDRLEYHFISLQEIIRHNLELLFPGMQVYEVMVFRVTRNADVERDEEDAEDLLKMVTDELRQRRFEKVVRLEHSPRPHPWMLRLLMQELEVEAHETYEIGGLLDYTTLKGIADLKLPALHFPTWTPVPPAKFEQSNDVFAAIRTEDILVHHPYECFNASVLKFLEAAADDPKVLAIKTTVYRIGDDGRFIIPLMRAAEAGKQVVCLVELKARFDEERNINLARSLEKSGVHVVYGIVGLKTHTKTMLIVRQEGDGIRCYAHIGTGNYNHQTARLYTDLGFFTCRAEITQDLVELFHSLTGRSNKTTYRKLLVAPVNMRDRFLELIQRECEYHQAGKPARIIAKMNALEDQVVCQKLYEAAQVGVPIQLIVRGFCCLRPQVPGLSDSIAVISIIGRFLEHSRIYHFANGHEDPQRGDFFLGSADWMHRNLLYRVEAIVPIESTALKIKLWKILEIMLKDQRQAWDMQPDGSYRQRQPLAEQTEAMQQGTHLTLMQLARHQNRYLEESSDFLFNSELNS